MLHSEEVSVAIRVLVIELLQHMRSLAPGERKILGSNPIQKWNHCKLQPNRMFDADTWRIQSSQFRVLSNYSGPFWFSLC